MTAHRLFLSLKNEAIISAIANIAVPNPGVTFWAVPAIRDAF
jgi:hypothetical protein